MTTMSCVWTGDGGGLYHPHRGAQGRPPVMVHNNWIVSALKKRKRFKEWGLWRPTLSPVEAQAAAKAEAGARGQGSAQLALA